MLESIERDREKIKKASEANRPHCHGHTSSLSFFFLSNYLYIPLSLARVYKNTHPGGRQPVTTIRKINLKYFDAYFRSIGLSRIHTQTDAYFKLYGFGRKESLVDSV